MATLRQLGKGAKEEAKAEEQQAKPEEPPEDKKTRLAKYKAL